MPADVKIVSIHAAGMTARNLAALLAAVADARRENPTVRAMKDGTVGVYIGGWDTK